MPDTAPSAFPSATGPAPSIAASPAAAAAKQNLTAPIAAWWNKYGLHAMLLVAVTVVGNFLYANTFGFYEDDWYFFAAPYSFTPHEWLNRLWASVLTLVQGRPLQMLYVYGFGYLGDRFGSIALLYVICAVFYSCSVVLLYRLLRVRFPVFFALLVSLLFALSPLTTIRQFLNGMLVFGPGFICLFLALILYARNRRFWSYLLAVAALFTYETIFLPFLGAPFFKRRRRNLREWILHLGMCAAALVILIMIRARTSEERVSGALAESSIRSMLSAGHSVVYYTLTSFRSYVYAAYLSCRELSWEALFWTVAVMTPALVLLFRSQTNATSPGRRRKLGRIRRWWWIRNAILPGGFFLAVGYALSWWHLGKALVYPFGRDTRVSTAASFGSSMLVGAILCWALTLPAARWWKTVVRGGIVLLLISLFLYSLIIQGDYTAEWREQQSLLTQLIMLTPDVDRNTLLVVRKPALPGIPLFPNGRRRPSIGWQVHGLSASIPILFGDGPRLAVVYSDDWKRLITASPDGSLSWPLDYQGLWGLDAKTPFRRIISLVEREDGSLYRADLPIYVAGRQVNESPANGKQSERYSNWNQLRQARLLPQVLPAFALTLSARGLNAGPPPFLMATAEVRFPANAPRTTLALEPLVVTGTSGAGDLVSVKYLGENQVVFRIDHWGSPGIEGGPQPIDPGKIYALEVTESQTRITLRLDGTEMLSLNATPFVTTKSQVTVGTNAIGGGITGPAFSGKIVSSSVSTAPPFPLNLIASAQLRFPAIAPKMAGSLEPLVVTGKPGVGDLVSVKYLAENKIMFRIDHWGSPGIEGGLMSIKSGEVYAVQVGEGDGGIVLRVNGDNVLTSNIRPFATTRDQVTIGANHIGGGITGPTFSGKVIASSISTPGMKAALN